MCLQYKRFHNQATTLSLSKGFTLIELLIVLVITGLVSSLLVKGLTNTWNSFAKLNTHQLTQQSLQLPRKWFRDSIKGAQLYHPEHQNFSGSENTLTLISTAAPGDELFAPRDLSWRIETTSSGTYLAFKQDNMSFLRVVRLPENSEFNYLDNGNWLPVFKPTSNKLPEAIRISNHLDTWTIVTPARPIYADIPAELPLFGEYSF